MTLLLRRRAWLVATVIALVALAERQFPVATFAQTTPLPAQLTDREFWELTEMVSEPNGEFQSDNFLSNERGYQVIIPELIATVKPARVYLGVGPEQNFPYIIALKPSLAIIFDVRRGNLHLHLLYKALFEMSADRAEFLARLFSRPRPDGLTKESTVAALMAAYRNVAPSEAVYQENLKGVADWLTKKHGFALHPGDLDGIDYVYRTAFFTGGPDLTYGMAGRGARGGRGGNNDSTYGALQSLDDGNGVNRGFLGSEAQWLAMKDFHTRNLLVPVVGDFGGDKAIRAVGAFLKARGALVSAFYLSNVEQYLNRSGVEDVFICSNVARLPIDESSAFIYTGAGRYGGGGGFGGGGGRGGGLNITFTRWIADDVKGCPGATPATVAEPVKN